MRLLRLIWKGLSQRSYLLLCLTTLMWAGNGVAGRLAVSEISPMALTCLRWVAVVMILGSLMGRQVAAEWPKLIARWPSLLWMAALGFTGFNALFYIAAHHTSAVNITIFQGAIPVFVLFGSILLLKASVRLLQIVGMMVTTVGVAVVATKGDFHVLSTMALNIGDVFMLIACAFYACYTLALPNRPPVSGLVFFTTLAGIAFLTTLPLLAYEMATGTLQWPTPKGLAVLLYVALFPSLLAQIFFIRSVELIGPGRAGLFVNLVPVFGSILAVLLLGEPFAFYHAAGLALVLGGIGLAELYKA
jgi:drug/metabolite transporter (DMT)-like permease